MMKFSVRVFSIFVFFVLILIGFHQFYLQVTSAVSPSFSRREIKDQSLDTNIMQESSDSAPRPGFVTTIEPVDIKTVNYFSNGTHLNATVWLNENFKEKISSDIEVLGYGMYIDADSDYNTGWEGVDYQLEITMNNGTWTQNLAEYSSSGENKTVDSKKIEDNFFAKNGNYVSLSLNLHALVFPEKYKLIFYAVEKAKDEPYKKIDFTDWVNIPPPESVYPFYPIT
jgi:hypothetical protein